MKIYKFATVLAIQVFLSAFAMADGMECRTTPVPDAPEGHLKITKNKGTDTYSLFYEQFPGDGGAYVKGQIYATQLRCYISAKDQLVRHCVSQDSTDKKINPDVSVSRVLSVSPNNTEPVSLNDRLIIKIENMPKTRGVESGTVEFYFESEECRVR
jgi:hypothetical protein